MLETKGLQIVETLATLKESSHEKIKAAAVGALWNLRDDLIKSEKKDYQNIGKYCKFKIFCDNIFV